MVVRCSKSRLAIDGLDRSLRKNLSGSLRKIEILARTVPSKDHGRPWEPCTPTHVITRHLLHSLGHKERCGRRVMQGPDSLLENSVLLILLEAKISMFWPERCRRVIMGDLGSPVLPFMLSRGISCTLWITIDATEGE